MTCFGIYYIPSADSDFYKLGSSLLGYDIREGKDLAAPPDFETEVSAFDKTWTERAKPYGFHLTIGDAIDCNNEDLEKVKNELSELVECFDSRRHPFLLTLREDKPISIWKNGTVVLKYAANEYLKVFHDLVTARINPIGSGSGYLRELDENAGGYKAARIRKFFSPYVLSSWPPHFTLLKPYKGDKPQMLKQYLVNRFGSFQELNVESLCVVVQYDGDPNFGVYDEIYR